MKVFTANEEHKGAMPKLPFWCRHAAGADLPEALQRLAAANVTEIHHSQEEPERAMPKTDKLAPTCMKLLSARVLPW